jgi:hypothetical protein
MAYETGAPPPPDLPHQVVAPEDRPVVPAVRPALGYDATTAIAGLGAPPPGVTTYRLKATETTETVD